MSVALYIFCGYTVSMAGRPKGPTGTARGNVLRIRLTDEERAMLDEAAAAVTLDTSTWARSELLALVARLTAQVGKRKPRPTKADGSGS
jgi:hypothetical protein